MAGHQFTPCAPRSQSALPFRRVLPRRRTPELDDDERRRLLAHRDALTSELHEVDVYLEMPSEDREAHQRCRLRFAQACFEAQSSLYPRIALPSLELPLEDRAAVLSARSSSAFVAGMRRRCGGLRRDLEFSKLKRQPLQLREALQENVRLQASTGTELLDSASRAPAPPNEPMKTEQFRRRRVKHFKAMLLAAC